MRKLQQFRVTVKQGKQDKKEKVGEVKKVVDSAAEHLVLESKQTLERETERSKAKKSIEIFNIWEDLGESKKVEKKEKPKTDK